LNDLEIGPTSFGLEMFAILIGSASFDLELSADLKIESDSDCEYREAGLLVGTNSFEFLGDEFELGNLEQTKLDLESLFKLVKGLL